nr:hypothetical protein [Streptomyces sp. LBUM 1477]
MAGSLERGPAADPHLQEGSGWMTDIVDDGARRHTHSQTRTVLPAPGGAA